MFLFSLFSVEETQKNAKRKKVKKRKIWDTNSEKYYFIHIFHTFFVFFDIMGTPLFVERQTLLNRATSSKLICEPGVKIFL